MQSLITKLGAVAAMALLAGIMFTSPADAGKIRITLAETPSDEVAAFFVALDRAKKNGLDYEWTAFS